MRFIKSFSILYLTQFFGRNNNGIPDSDSDIEIPCLALRACYELDKLTSLVYVYFIQMIQNHGFSYTQIIRKFKRREV